MQKRTYLTQNNILLIWFTILHNVYEILFCKFEKNFIKSCISKFLLKSFLHCLNITIFNVHHSRAAFQFATLLHHLLTTPCNLPGLCAVRVVDVSVSYKKKRIKIFKAIKPELRVMLDLPGALDFAIGVVVSVGVPVVQAIVPNHR